MEVAASTASGERRTLLGFVEAQGNSSYRCNPSGPCIACQYSEKVLSKQELKLMNKMENEK